MNSLLNFITEPFKWALMFAVIGFALVLAVLIATLGVITDVWQFKNKGEK